jgi:hypothetical protein
MTRGVRKYLVSSVVLVALIGVAGCSHYLLAEREPWRHDAELACLNSGAVKESPTRVRIASIQGPGMCGMDYPLRISSLGDSTPLGYDDEPLLPPSSIPNTSMPQHWPIIQSSALPPPQPYAPPPVSEPPGSQYGGAQYGQPRYGAAPPPVPSTAQPQYGQPPYSQSQYGQSQYGQSQYGGAESGAPMSLTPPGAVEPEEDETEEPPAPGRYDGAASAGPAQSSGPTFAPRAEPPPPAAGAAAPYGAVAVPLGPERAPEVIASVGPVEVKPAATLACPIVSMLDQWISAAVQPAALQWFRQPVVEIKQISSYSCRGMNGNPNAHISEHAFGNALDIAEFTLADGHKISVQYGWHGTPEEQGFLRDVQAAACQDFTTVLAPGANVYHYNHIHVDLMRHYNGRHICEPAAMSGEVAAERARAHYAAQHYGDPGVTGSIATKMHRPALGYSDDNDDRPDAVPGDD